MHTIAYRPPYLNKLPFLIDKYLVKSRNKKLRKADFRKRIFKKLKYLQNSEIFLKHILYYIETQVSESVSSEKRIFQCNFQISKL